MGLATEDEEEDLCFGSSGVGTRRPELEAWYRGSDGGEDLDIFSWPRTAVGWELINIKARLGAMASIQPAVLALKLGPYEICMRAMMYSAVGVIDAGNAF
jgi:hypothetical protein